jgi:hypothetical protein
MKIFYYIKRFWEIPAIEKRILFKGLLIAFLIRLIVYILPIKYYIKFISLKPKVYLTDDINLSIIMSKKTLRRIIRIFPFTKNCLLKAITLKYILYEFGINSKCVFSLKKINLKNMHAHAYLIIDPNLTLFRDSEYCDVFAL